MITQTIFFNLKVMTISEIIIIDRVHSASAFQSTLAKREYKLVMLAGNFTASNMAFNLMAKCHLTNRSEVETTVSILFSAKREPGNTYQGRCSSIWNLRLSVWLITSLKHKLFIYPTPMRHLDVPRYPFVHIFFNTIFHYIDRQSNKQFLIQWSLIIRFNHAQRTRKYHIPSARYLLADILNSYINEMKLR